MTTTYAQQVLMESKAALMLCQVHLENVRCAIIFERMENKGSAS